ncbi:MAG: hypothetical protein EPGJADBJ_01729 [Saprospiraceae bacterium]|nr:hypothetical protein [Saprospiraceae bacterium]
MRKLLLAAVLLTAVFQIASAQMPNDGLMMGNRQWCTLLQYTHTSWDEYWEGTNKRSNLNLGTFTGQNVMLMTNFGITDNLNVMAGVPYVWTDSDSYLDGQSGLQDLSVFLKYQPFKTAMGGGDFKVQVTGGASIPVTDYVPDFLPLSIGLQSKTASLRGILNFTHGSGFYVTAQAGHTWRSNITIDREAYLYDNELYYTDEMPVPNVFDATGRLGFINNRIQAEVMLDYFTGLSGDDIRYNEMPLPCNKMQATTAGVFAKYFIWQGLAVQASYGQVLSGRNFGQGTTISGGVTYFFTLGGQSQSTE